MYSLMNSLLIVDPIVLMTVHVKIINGQVIYSVLTLGELNLLRILVTSWICHCVESILYSANWLSTWTSTVTSNSSLS